MAALRTKSPMRANQMPPIGSPRKKKKAPRSMRMIPNADPSDEEMRVAHRRFPFQAQRAERSTRPPSRGKAGIKLKMARVRLMPERKRKVPPAAMGHPAAVEMGASAKNPPARTKLAMGPAMAMRNSARAVGGSFSISATPPKMKSVM